MESYKTDEVKESVVEFDSDDDDQPPHKVQKTTTNTTVKNAQHEMLERANLSKLTSLKQEIKDVQAKAATQKKMHEERMEEQHNLLQHYEKDEDVGRDVEQTETS